MHTQNIEGCWSILKRGIIGTFHHVGEHRLPTWWNEFEYRFSARKIPDADRIEALVSQTHGRLDWHRCSQDLHPRACLLCPRTLLYDRKT
ncbi:MAG: transposase [Chloroflexi bacterium]|nr:transposase [Chloroflexota bacterium]